jgi:hypothetical protein
MPANMAIFFNFHSNDFLLQYSLELLIHHIHKPSQPLGDINRMDMINNIHDATIKIINNVRIF